MSKPPKELTKKLTPAQIKYAQRKAIHDNGTRAVLEAYPESNLTHESASVKSSRLLRNDNINAYIDFVKSGIANLAPKALERVEELLDSDNEKIAESNAWKIIEHTKGKPEAKTQTTQLNISIEKALE